MPLDPDVALMLQQQQAAGIPPMSAGTPAEGRAMLRAVAGVDRRDPAALPPVPDVRDAVVGGVPARVYRAAAAPAPTIVYLHGGGFVIGDLDTHDVTVRLLALATRSAVVSVDYALAPEHPFPAGLDDAWNAFSAVVADIGAYGGDPARVGIAGDSAGATLAAVTAVRARDEGVPLAAQLLAYPAVDPLGDHPSRTLNANGYFLTLDDIEWFSAQYLGVAADPRISLLRADLGGLAPAVVATAEYDPLRDEGVAYAEALAAAGVPVTARTWPGMVHGFYGTPLPGPLAATASINAAFAELLAV